MSQIKKQAGLSRFVFCIIGSTMLLVVPGVALAQSTWRDEFSGYYYSDQETENPQQGPESGDAGRNEYGSNGEERSEPPESGSSEEEFPEWVPPGEPRKIEAEFGEGFALVSKDEEFELRFHILTQIDFKFFSPGDQEPSGVDGVYIPRLRVYFEGKLTDPFRYEVSLQRSVEGEFDILDANLDIVFSEGCQLRFGRMLIPYSYSWYDHLEHYFIVPERALFPLNYGLARAAGIQLSGKDILDRWEYSTGVFDGRATGLADDSTSTDFVSYLNLRPFVTRRPGGLLENLNIGGSLAVGKNRRPAELLPARTSIQSSENDEASRAASAVFLEFEPDVVGFGDRLLGGIHAALYRGPVSIEAEWNAGNEELLNEDTDETANFTVNGFHVTFATFLTGETVRRREVVQPCFPFDPRFGCSQLGAFEPFVRYSYLQIEDSVFDRGFIDADDWTDEVSMTDIGMNWYLNRYVKFYFDWQHAAYASPVLVNEEIGKFSTFNDTYWVRCQFYF